MLLLSSLAAAQDLPGGEWSGPFVDKVVFRYFDALDNETPELLDGSIDAIGCELSFQETQAFRYNEDIEVHEISGTSFYYFALNCRRFPTNVTAFRQAFAYSYNKNSIVDQYTGQIQAQDSCIPQGSIYHVGPPYEGEFYSQRCEVANVLLDESGFIDVDHDGYREAPDGSSVAVRIIEYNNETLSHSIALEAVNALEQLGIASILDTNDVMLPLQDLHQSPWNMILLQSDFKETQLNWFNYHFHPTYNTSANPYWNLEGFDNTQLLLSLLRVNQAQNQSQAIAHAKEIQRILINQCPIVPICSPVKYYAHRTEEFSNLHTDPFDGILSWWTLFKMSLRPESGGPYGGSFTYSLKGNLESINPLQKPSSAIEQLIVDCLYDRLLITNKDGADRLRLASKATVDYHSTTPDFPIGSTRITIRIRSNAIWTQKSYAVYNLTASDVASALLYHFNAEDTYGFTSNSTVRIVCKNYWVLDSLEDFIAFLVSPLGAFIVLPLAVSIACSSAYLVFNHDRRVSADR